MKKIKKIVNPLTKNSTLSLFIEDNSLHFEYGHCIPKSTSCSVIHGHSAKITLEVFGNPDKEGMIVEFRLIKDALKKVLHIFDHKFIVAKQYATLKKDRYFVSFDGPNGYVEFNVPASHIILLSGDPTSENMVKAISDQLEKVLPKKVLAFSVVFFEGATKGAILTRKRNNK